MGRGPVIWKSKKQPFVTLSTAEAEFINLTPAGQALIWIDRLLTGSPGSRQVDELGLRS